MSDRNSYDDFFRTPDERERERADNMQKEAGHPDDRPRQEERPSYYYSYGPFRSSAESARNESANGDNTPYTTETGRTEQAEITAPRQVYPYWNGARPQTPAPTMQQWQVNPPKKGGKFRTVVASMLTGALVMGSLMFASDRLNWFGGSPGAYASNGSGAGIRTVSSEGTVASSNAGGVVRPGNIADMVEKASPAVVKIETYSSRSTNRGFYFNDDIFRYFFGDEFGSPNRQQQKLPTGMGSGFFFDKSGYILTNEHVIAGADEIYVTVLGHKERYKAEKMGTSRDLDLAVIKIKGDGDFPTLPLGDSNSLRVGDWVTAIGNPVGFDHSVSVGVLSAKEREFDIPDGNGVRSYEHLLQTDASINPGNSGGPLLNLAGEVIGINTAVSAQAQGIGFAIPSSTVLEVLDNLKNNMKTPIPFLGIQMGNVANLNDQVKKELKLDSDDGVIVMSVVEGSPASKSDIQPYDVIVEFNGEKVKNIDDLQTKLKATKPGQRVNVTLVRDGQRVTTAVIIGDRNEFGG